MCHMRDTIWRMSKALISNPVFPTCFRARKTVLQSSHLSAAPKQLLCWQICQTAEIEELAVKAIAGPTPCLGLLLPSLHPAPPPSSLSCPDRPYSLLERLECYLSILPTPGHSAKWYSLSVGRTISLGAVNVLWHVYESHSWWYTCTSGVMTCRIGSLVVRSNALSLSLCIYNLRAKIGEQKEGEQFLSKIATQFVNEMQLLKLILFRAVPGMAFSIFSTFHPQILKHLQALSGEIGAASWALNGICRKAKA